MKACASVEVPIFTSKHLLRLGLVVSLFILVASFSYAEESPLVMPESATLNVIHTDPAVTIFIDGTLAGTKSVFGYRVNPGSHLVRIEKNGHTLFSEVISIEAGRVKTINGETFIGVKTNNASKGAIEAEMERIKDAKGSIGLGIMASPLSSGFSVKYFFLPDWGAQLSGFAFSTDQWSYYNEGIRLIYVMANTLAQNSPLSLYSFGGFSQNGKRDANSDNVRDSVEVGLGMEFNLVKGLEENSICYLSIEVALHRQNLNHSLEFEGTSLSGGMHYYF